MADDKVALCFIITTSLQLFSREIYDQEIENEIRDAFIIFDKEGQGFISSGGYQPSVYKISAKTDVKI